MVASPHTAGQPETVMVETIAAGVAELTVLSTIRNHYLWREREEGGGKWAISYLQHIHKTGMCNLWNRISEERTRLLVKFRGVFRS